MCVHSSLRVHLTRVTNKSYFPGHRSLLCCLILGTLELVQFINPRRACAARVTIVVLCVCVCPLISAASHIGITNERYQWVHSNTGIVLNFADFLLNASFKSYGVICLPRAPPAS